MARLDFYYYFCFCGCGQNPASPLPTFKAVFIGNSLSGGANVGGRNDDEINKCTNNPIPWPPQQQPSTNPGDVPSKVKLLFDAANLYDFQWAQNTRSAHFLSTHARAANAGIGGCLEVNQAMIADMASSSGGGGNDLDALIIQAQSAELMEPTCIPDAPRVANLNVLLNLVSSSSSTSTTRTYLSTTWAPFDDPANAVCNFEALRCTEEEMVVQQSIVYSYDNLQLLPVGQGFQYVADANCVVNQGGCGYVVSESCTGTTSLWSNTNPNGRLFVDTIHQSDEAGAWLSALITYGGIQAPSDGGSACQLWNS